MPISEEVRNKIIALKQHTSKSNREIARDLGLNDKTVGNILKKWEQTGSIKSYEGAKMGKKPRLSKRENAVIVREAKRDPKASSREIKEAAGPVGQKVSTTTVRRILLANGLKSYRPVKKPLLTKMHIKKRLEWARAHKDWTVDHWKKVRFILTIFIIF